MAAMEVANSVPFSRTRTLGCRPPPSRSTKSSGTTNPVVFLPLAKSSARRTGIEHLLGFGGGSVAG